MKIVKKTFQVSGVTCSSCVARIENVLDKIEGIKNISINIASEEAQLEYNKDIVTLEQINNSLKDHGYSFQEKDKLSESPLKLKKDNKENSAKYQELNKLKPKALFSFYIAVFIFVFMITEVVLHFLDIDFFIPMQLWQYIQLIIATTILAIAGDRFFAGIWRFIRFGRADMNTLVGIGTTVAYIYSTVILLLPFLQEKYNLPNAVYYDATIVVIGFVLYGKYLEKKSKLKTGEAISALVTLQAKVAHVKRNEELVNVPIDEVRVGDICVVKVGEKIPVDGNILEGTTHIDESMITGESLPVKRTVNER